jgi:hypothetical protein
MNKNPVIFICSPFSGDIERNTAKAARYCRFAYSQKVVPYAPHLHNPQFLDESISDERKAGIRLGLQLLMRSDEMWIFGHKLTDGMRTELNVAQQLKIKIRYFTDMCVEREANSNE